MSRKGLIVIEYLLFGNGKGCSFALGTCTCADPSSSTNCNWPGSGYTCSVPNQVHQKHITIIVSSFY